MRNDITKSYEDFERLAEDYFDLIPPDTDSLDLELTLDWEFNDDNKLFIFYFENEWLLDEFLNKLEECPKLNESVALNDMFDGVDREKLVITLEGRQGGLI